MEFADYLEHRDRLIAYENLNTLREFIDSLPPDATISVQELKEILRNA